MINISLVMDSVSLETERSPDREVTAPCHTVPPPTLTCWSILIGRHPFHSPLPCDAPSEVHCRISFSLSLTKLPWMTRSAGRQHLLPKASLRHQAVLHLHRRHSSALNTPYFTQSRPLTVSRQTPHFCKYSQAAVSRHKSYFVVLSPVFFPWFCLAAAL